MDAPPCARPARVCCHVAGLIILVLGATNQPVRANSGGIIGVSGKPPSNALVCNSCHGGGSPSPKTPLVRFDGPTTVAPGSTTTYTFIVTSQAPDDQIAAGLDVSASGGTLGVVAGQGTRLAGGEITQTAPKQNDENNEARWQFTWRAPNSTGSHTLYGAGNSVDFDRTSSRDRAARTTLVISVGAVEPSATPSPTPTHTLVPPTPTDTATATATPTFTVTLTATPSTTPSPTVPTSPTPTTTGPRPPCIGDCAGLHVVSVDQLVAGVRIALGDAPLSLCPAFDGNDDRAVTVDELVEGVNNALNGCP
jgi:hypothetical protein